MPLRTLTPPPPTNGSGLLPPTARREGREERPDLEGGVVKDSTDCIQIVKDSRDVKDSMDG